MEDNKNALETESKKHNTFIIPQSKKHNEPKESFLLYTEQGEVFEKLSDEEAGKLIKGIYQYVAGNQPALIGMASIAFVPIKQQIDRNAKKYEEKREKLRQNGLKGGRPTKTEKAKDYEKKQMVLEKSKKSLNDNVHVNDNDNVNDINILSLNKNKISDEEREILNRYVTKHNLAQKSVVGYVNKLIENGDYITILNEETAKLKKEDKSNIDEDVKQVKDELSAIRFIAKYGDQLSDVQLPQVEKIMNEYGFESINDVAKASHRKK